MRVGLIGHGAIGHTVARALDHGDVPNCTLSGVLRRGQGPAPRRLASVEELIDGSDVVVEAAGQEAVRVFGPPVRRTGVDLVVVSVGALIDEDLLTQLRAGSGRLLLCSGAVGGLELLRAAALGGGLDRVELRTTKPASALIENWMDADLVTELRRGTRPLTVFQGAAREAARRFPASVNVAATVALSTLGLDGTTVTVVADPGAQLVTHEIMAQGTLGSYHFQIENRPTSQNPRTSAIVAYAVLRCLTDLTETMVIA